VINFLFSDIKYLYAKRGSSYKFSFYSAWVRLTMITPANFIVTIDWEKEKPEIGGSDIYESIEETTLIILDIFKNMTSKLPF